MPYITPKAREVLEEPINHLAVHIATNGELNYCITRLVLSFLHGRVNYLNLAGVVGTLHLISTELERRVINPYEDRKIAENGDVAEYRDGI